MNLQFFAINTGTTSETWAKIRRACPNLTKWGEDILRSGLDEHARGVILESDYVCKDYRNLHSNFFAKKFVVSPSNCSRLHFFTTPVETAGAMLSEGDKLQNNYIGFSVICPLPERCLGRTVISQQKIGKQAGAHFYSLSTPFNVHLAGLNLSVSGYPYIAQTTDVTVCSHASLWGVCRYLSERYPKYAELYPYDLVECVEQDRGRRTPYRGMTYGDYSRILASFGCHPIVMRTSGGITQFNMNNKNLYAYAESGLPILVSMKDVQETSSHVVTIIGHTLDYNQHYQVDYNGFVDSSAFLKQYVVVDDNCFPYQLLGYQTDEQNYMHGTPTMFSLERVTSAVCPLPEKAYLPAEIARQLCIEGFREALATTHQTMDAQENAPLVTRLFLTSINAFKRRKLENFRVSLDGRPDFIEQMVTVINMPHFIWVMEVSPLSQYKQGKCCAEIVLDASAGKSDINAVIYARVRNSMTYSNHTQSWDTAPREFNQFTHNLGERSQC